MGIRPDICNPAYCGLSPNQTQKMKKYIMHLILITLFCSAGFIGFNFYQIESQKKEAVSLLKNEYDFDDAIIIWSKKEEFTHSRMARPRHGRMFCVVAEKKGELFWKLAFLDKHGNLYLHR